MNKKALPYYIPGLVLVLWGGLWGITGFYSSQAPIVIGMLAVGVLLLWLGQRTQQKAESNNRDTFGNQ